MEQWKIISDNPNYEISNYGRIRRIKSGLIMKGGNKKGYKIFVSKSKGIRYTKTIHRLVATHFIPNPNNYPHINHIDADKANNNVNNLEWCDNQMNTDHAVNLGRIPRIAVRNKITGEILRSAYELSKLQGWSYSTTKQKLKGYYVKPFEWEYFNPIALNVSTQMDGKTAGHSFSHPRESK